MAKIDVSDIKKRILAFIEQNGPSLPNPVAKQIGLQPMFAAAILSELLNEKRVKTSSMKIGSSPLYLLYGQEPKLEIFTENLTGVEKEAFLKLKDNKLLEDQSQEPKIRVALRGIKDFAIPLQINNKLYWKYFTASENKIKESLEGEGNVAIGERVVGQQIWEDIKKEAKPENPKETHSTHEEIVKVISAEANKTFSKEKIENPKPIVKEEPRIENIFEEPKTIEKIPQDNKPQKIKKLTEKDIFLEQVKRILETKNIEILEVIQYDTKQLIAKARIHIDKTCILLFMDKKRPEEKDLQKVYKKSLEYKLPYYIFTQSQPPKKLKDTADLYKALLGFGSQE
jgi:hypothetical protein